MNSNSEGLSNAMLEAMSKSLVVIVKKIRSNKDILKDKFNCLLFKNKYELEKILKKKNNIKKLSKNSFMTVKEKFNINIITKKYIELYQKLK